MKGSPLGPGGEDITWPDQVAPRGRRTSSTRNLKPQTSNRTRNIFDEIHQNSKYPHCNQGTTGSNPQHEGLQSKEIVYQQRN